MFNSFHLLFIRNAQVSARVQFLSYFSEHPAFNTQSIPFIFCLSGMHRFQPVFNPFRIFQNILHLTRSQFLSSFVYQECTGFSPCSIPFVVYLIGRQRINFSNPSLTLEFKSENPLFLSFSYFSEHPAHHTHSIPFGVFI